MKDFLKTKEDILKKLKKKYKNKRKEDDIKDL